MTDSRLFGVLPGFFFVQVTLTVFLFSASCLAGAPEDQQAMTKPVETQPALQTIELTLIDSGSIYYGTFQSHNQKVVSTPDGIFLTYSGQQVLTDPNAPDTANWRLMRSTDGGKTFQIAYQAVCGTRAPVLEADEDGNLYLAHPDWNTAERFFYFYRFPRGGDYSRPLITAIPNASCGAKFAMAYDPGRQRFYIALQFGQLITVGIDGRFISMQQAMGQSGQHAGTQYPHLAVSPDGALHYGMTTCGDDGNGHYLYWDIHYMNSPDGGLTWRKLDGTPLPPAPIPDDTGPTDRISTDDDFGHSNWLGNMLPKDGKVHFIYQGKEMHYFRYDRETGKQDLALNGREFSGKTITLWHGSGQLTSRSDQPGSPLYCVTRDPICKTLACLVSYDNGQSWSDYAIADRQFNSNYATSGSRELTDDGWIIGTFTDHASSNPPQLEVWFYRIKVR